MECNLVWREPIDPAAVRVTFDLSQKWLARSLPVQDDRVKIDIPLQIRGVPEGMNVRADGLSVSIEGPGGAVWRSQEKPWMQIDSEAKITSLETRVEGAFYRKIREQPVRLHGRMYLTLGGHLQETNIPFDNRKVAVPGAGVCSASREHLGSVPQIRSDSSEASTFDSRMESYMLLCHSAFRPPASFLSVSFEHAGTNLFREPISYSPFPAELSLSPVKQYFAPAISPRPISAATILASRPVAFIRRDFDLTGVRLRDFEAQPGNGPQ